jgi:hypothetical protein
LYDRERQLLSRKASVTRGSRAGQDFSESEMRMNAMLLIVIALLLAT